MTQRRGVQPLEKWIDQYQLVGRRSLSEEERELLAAELKENRRPEVYLAIGFCSVLLMVAVAFAALYNQALFAPMLAGALLATAALPLHWSRQVRRYREDLADLHLGEAEIYETVDQTEKLVFLPRSCRLLGKCGCFVRNRVHLHVNAIWRQHVRPQTFPGQMSLQGANFAAVRVLTRFERAELAEHMPRRTFLSWLLTLSAWICCFALCLFLGRFRLLPAEIGQILLLLIAAISLMFYYGYRQKRYAAVKTDLSRGTVVCEQVGSFQFEHLEGSDILWTIDRNPAPWRKKSSRSWFCPTI